MGKTYIKLIFFYLGFVFSINAFAQGIAVNISSSIKNNSASFYNNLKNQLARFGQDNYVFYNWSNSKLTYVSTVGHKEIPSNFAFFIKTTKIMYNTRVEAYSIEYVDVSTGEVLDYAFIKSDLGKTGTYAGFVPDYKKIAKEMLSMADRTVYDLSYINKGSNNLKYVKIPAGKNKYVKSNTELYLYGVTYNEGLYSKEEFKFLSVNEISQDSSKYKISILQSRSKLYKQFLKYDQIFGIRNSRLSSLIHPAKAKHVVKLQINLKADIAFDALKNNLIQEPNILVLDRDIESELKILRDLYTDEAFMDHELREIKEVGAEFLLTFKDDRFVLTNIKNGHRHQTGKRKYGEFFKKAVINDYETVKNLLLFISGNKIELLKVLKETDTKTKSLRLFHLYGFGDKEDYDIYTIYEEKVRGKTVERKELIAEGVIYCEGESKNYGVLKVSSGNQKKLHKTLKDNGKIVIINHNALKGLFK